MKTAKKLFAKIPLFPLSALIFYVLVFFLWNKGIIPTPAEIVLDLEGLYVEYATVGLIVATTLESLAYICLYVPGSFVIALAVFFSDGSFFSLMEITLIVALTLTATSVINYFVGRVISSKKAREKLLDSTELAPRGLITAILHPNFLAFYFFHSGLEHKNIKNTLYVPILMIPYGLLVAYLLSIFSGPARQGLENPYLLLIFVVIWFVTSVIKEYRKPRREDKSSE